MKKLMHLLLLSCLKATELIEKRFQVELTFKEKIQLKLHTSMCKACKSYGEQSHVIENALFEMRVEDISQKEISDLKISIIKTIEKK